MAIATCSMRSISSLKAVFLCLDPPSRYETPSRCSCAAVLPSAVARKIEIDDLHCPGGAAIAVRANSWIKRPGSYRDSVSRKETDLRNVGASGDVNQIVFGVGIERDTNGRNGNSNFVNVFKNPRDRRNSMGVEAHLWSPVRRSGCRG